MTQWDGKAINLLTDDELWAAIHSVAQIELFRFDKLKDKRILKEGSRLNKIFKNTPPAENENFTNLVQSLNDEWKKRNEDT